VTQSTDKFAPISGQPSGRLRLVSGYLLGSGILLAAFVVAGIIGMLLRKPPTGVWRVAFANLAVRSIVAAGWITSGVLLQRRSMLGGLIALAMFFVPIVASLFLHQPVPRLTLIVAGIGAVLVLSAFDELNRAATE
jgi:hypothetical protein